MIMSELSHYFVFQDQQLWMLQTANTQQYELPSAPQVIPLQSHTLQQRALGTIHHVPCFCIELATDAVLPEHSKLIPLRQAFELLDPMWIPTACTALQTLHWHKSHQYCGQCGHQTYAISDPNLARRCSHCDAMTYPNAVCAIIVRIQKGDQILMARSPHFEPGVHALIAGFVEFGESAETAVHREVLEEVGIHITNIRYFASQSWPFTNTLLLGFTAEYESGDLTLDPIEIESAGWYTADTIPGMPSSSRSLSAQLIEDFLVHQKQ